MDAHWYELTSEWRVRIRTILGIPSIKISSREANKRQCDLTEFLSLTQCLQVAARNFEPRGRPRERALFDYALSLALIYENATGIEPRRRYNHYRQNQGEAEHLPFFAACMTAAGVAKYPSRIIRQALQTYSAHLCMRVWTKTFPRSKT